MQMLDRIAEAGGVLRVVVAFTQVNGTATVPSSASWRLTDVEGNVVNGRSNVAITVGGLSYAVVYLQGADLAVDEGERAELVERRLRVKWTYTGDGAARTPYSVLGFKVRRGVG